MTDSISSEMEEVGLLKYKGVRTRTRLKDRQESEPKESLMGKQSDFLSCMTCLILSLVF